MNSETRDTHEVRMAILETTAAIAEIETRRCALEEIRDDLEITAREATHRLSEVREDVDALGARLREKRERVASMERELADMKAELSFLEHQLTIRTRRAETLAKKARTLASDVASEEGASSEVQAVLQRIHASVTDMDAKLRFAQRKHRAIDDDADET